MLAAVQVQPRNPLRARLALLVVVALTCAAGRAGAQDVSTVYDAVKSVNDQLVTQRVAGDAAGHLACASPRLARYYRSSLRLLRRRQWGQLRSALRDDTIDLVGDAIYAAAKVPPAGDALTAFIGPVKTPSACTPEELATADAALAVDVPRESTDVDACAAQGTAQRRKDLACDLALAVKAMLRGSGEQARNDLVELLTAAFFAAFATSAEGPRLDVLFERTVLELAAWVRDDGAKHDTIEDTLGEALKGVDPQAVDLAKLASCKDPSDEELLRLAATGGLDATALVCGATRERPAASLEKAAIVVTGHGASRSVPLSALAPGREDALGETLLCAANLDPADRAFADCSSGSLKPLKSTKLTASIPAAGVAWDITVTVAPGVSKLTVSPVSNGASLSALVSGVSTLRTLASALESFLRARLLSGGEVEPARRRPLTLTALRIERLLRGLRPLRTTPGSAGDLLVFFDAARSVAKASPELCGETAGGQASTLCEQLARVDELTRPRGALREIVVESARGDLRELAVRAMSIFFAKESVDLDTCADNPPYGAFFAALTAYVLDDTATGDQLTLSREAFRSAAVDLARCTSTSGIERASRYEFLRTSFDLVPSFALRFSWNQGYKNQLGADGYRLAPSLDFLIARIRLDGKSSTYYAGLTLSALDLLAPIDELAYRRSDVSYDNQDNLWLEFIHPRVDLTFGLPALSEHVFVSAGASLRLAPPFAGRQIDSATSPTPGYATYIVVGSSDDRATNAFAEFVEVNLALKYVF
jgi:hypothetical protein